MISFKQFITEGNPERHYAEHNKWKGHPMLCPYCEKRTRHFERTGMTTSDAQGVAEAEHLAANKKAVNFG